MILLQQVVTGDTTYTVVNQANLVVFDVHNDSPYNMGVSFGHDTGIQNAEYFTSAHSILYGIGPIAAQQRSVGGVKWTGTIYIYTQTPAGGGNTDLSNAPAKQITVIGYPAGYNPAGTTSLSRMNNIANPVSTSVTSTNSIVNSGNPPGTSIISATPSDAASATWTADTSGNLTVKGDNSGTLTTLIQLIAGASPSVKLAAAAVLTEALGNLKVDGTFESVGAATCDSTLTVTGTSLLTGAVTASAAMTVNGTLTGAGSGGIVSTSGAFYGTDGSNTIIQSSGTSGSGNTRLQNTDHISIQVPGGSEAIGVNSSQVTIEKSLIFNGQLGVSSAADVIDASTGADTYIKCRSTGNINFQSPNGTTVAHFDTSGQLNVAHSIILVNGSIGQLKNLSGTGSATVSTGITNPTSIAFDPCTASGSSQTIGGTIASSTVVTAGAGLAWAATAWHA